MWTRLVMYSNITCISDSNLKHIHVSYTNHDHILFLGIFTKTSQNIIFTNFPMHCRTKFKFSHALQDQIGEIIWEVFVPSTI